MANYVAGFLFSPNYEEVLLIRKKRPEWQRGKLNGIGGHIKEKETADEAMRREFLEEAGMDVDSWKLFCHLECREGSWVYFYYAVGDVTAYKPLTDEIPEIVSIPALLLCDILPNLAWLIPMARTMGQERINHFGVKEIV